MSASHGLIVPRRALIGGLSGLAVAVGAGSALALAPKVRGRLLDRVSRWNDAAQRALYSPERLAPTYTKDEITAPFRYNGFYPEAYAPRLDATRWRLELGGAIERKAPLGLAELRAMPQAAQITRLICIEGWSAVGEWSGVPLRHVLESVGADTSAPFVSFRCADDYHTSIDMASALHPQTIVALDFLGRPLPRAFGAPARLRIPVKLGFKNAKFITEIAVHHDYRGGYWEDQGYNWFAGL